MTVEETLLTRSGRSTATTPSLRSLPKAIAILLPVWGDEYIEQFLEQSLPTLLAPGNIPALAMALPTRFVFLTRARDEPMIRADRAGRRLSQVVPIEFLPIDDLITRGNHSTTITLAYARAVRQAGALMTDTCFFFLVSDYIMADGSLAAVLARVRAGASAVQVGNFQLEEDAAQPWLLQQLAATDGVLALRPREVMRWALRCLHPITAANTINFPLCHNTDANRLLWRVDGSTLIGRFYLLHMICIRPETDDFVIGSSCDYSFVPEMCPSGKSVTITDSDDYLVVEIQPAWHEHQFIRLGPMTPEALAHSLSRWTTKGHRANAEETIVFHAGELPPTLPTVLAEADVFVGQLTALLSPKPQPHRDHPYWRGAIAAFDAQVAERSGALQVPWPVRVLRRMRAAILGVPPEVTRVHPRWKDFARPLAACRELTADPSSRVLIGASSSTVLVEWLRKRLPTAVLIPFRRLLRTGKLDLPPRSFDSAFIELLDSDVDKMAAVLDLIGPTIRPGGQIVITAINTNWYADPEHFDRLFARGFGSLNRTALSPEDFHVCSASRLRWRLNRSSISAMRAFTERPTLSAPFDFVVGLFCFPIVIALNLISSWQADHRSPREVASSIFIRFRIVGDAERQ